MTIDQLNAAEFNPYYSTYINKVGSRSLMDALIKGKEITTQFFNSIPEAKIEYSYAEGKWTPKELLLHLIDVERVFTVRALFFARSEDAKLSGFDENIFADNSYANTRTMKSLVEEYNLVRNSTIILFNSFSEETLKKIGNANKSVLSVRAAGFIICGHEIHHMNVISERYL